MVVLATMLSGNVLCSSTSSEVWKHLYGALWEGTKPQEYAVLVVSTQILSPTWHSLGPYLLSRKASELSNVSQI